MAVTQEAPTGKDMKRSWSEELVFFNLKGCWYSGLRDPYLACGKLINREHPEFSSSGIFLNLDFFWTDLAHTSNFVPILWLHIVAKLQM